MPRIAGVDVPENKRVEVALTYIYGMGPTSAKKTLAECGISPDLRARDLTSEDLTKLRGVIEANYMVEGELRKTVTNNIKRLREIKSYRGMRHLKGLPVRGQRTKTNARTRKGKRK